MTIKLFPRRRTIWFYDEIICFLIESFATVTSESPVFLNICKNYSERELFNGPIFCRDPSSPIFPSFQNDNRSVSCRDRSVTKKNVLVTALATATTARLRLSRTKRESRVLIEKLKSEIVNFNSKF